jgi:hypothetical protein
MRNARPLSLSLILPLLMFGMSALAAKLAAQGAKFIAPEPITLLDAAMLENDEALLRMVLERPVFEWRRGDQVSPLLVAIAGGDTNRVAYMARHTAHLGDTPVMILHSAFQRSSVMRRRPVF